MEGELRNSAMMPHLEVSTLYLENQQVTLYSAHHPTPRNEPVLFLHGWGLSPRSYSPYLRELSNALHSNIYAPALPGFGGTNTLKDAADADHLLAFLQQALEQLGLDTPPILIGHSLGAALAARLAATTPTPLDPRLVLISPAGVHHEGAGGRGVRDALAMAFDLRHEIPHSPLERLRDAGPSFLRNPRAVLQAGWTAAHIDIHPDLRRLADRNARITVITADGDTVTPHTAALALPGVRIETVHGTHGWILSEPQRAADLTCDVLDDGIGPPP